MEDGPQTFRKGDSEDTDEDRETRRQIINIGDDKHPQISNRESKRSAKTGVEHRLTSDPQQVNTRSQIHQLFYNKPSESLEQDYLQNNTNLMQDLEDEESMFDHLN